MVRSRGVLVMLVGSLMLAACGFGEGAKEGVLGRGTTIGSGEPWSLRVELDDSGLLCLELSGGQSCFEVPDGSQPLYAAGESSDVAEANPNDGWSCASGRCRKTLSE